EMLELGIGDRLAGAEVSLGSEIELLALVLDAERVEHLERLADDLRPGAVAPDDPEPMRHSPAPRASRAASLGAGTTKERFTAARYARALASTTSVATPRPVTRRPSTSSWITTSPKASVPPVTALTLNETSRPSIPEARWIAPIAASIIPSPIADSSTISSPRRSRTLAVGDSAVPPPTWSA